MLTHLQIWRAIDTLAARCSMSPSGMAKLAGLDPTTFNKSKRVTASGKLRWPSTESISKVLVATGTSLEDFVKLTADGAGLAHRGKLMPLIGMAQASHNGYFDEAGFPVGSKWEEIAFPELPDGHCYALEITGDTMAPVYRDGDHIIVAPSANLRRGDRVVARTQAGELLARQLVRITAQRIELKSFNPAFEDCNFALSEICFVHRIIWASQ